LLNLVLNALDAMPGGGRLEVAASYTDDPEGVSITVRDTGVGMDPETKGRLFRPFHSSRPDGLGMGLYVSHRIVDEHGGHIQVESAEGDGSTFAVWLPA
jgi:signal transduction histidine kinase